MNGLEAGIGGITSDCLYQGALVQNMVDSHKGKCGS